MEDNTELRSEKLRSVMGRIPRTLVVTDTVVIVIITAILVAFAWICLN